MNQYKAKWTTPLDLTPSSKLISSSCIPDPHYVSLQSPRGTLKLTLRQWEILKIAAQGFSVKEIGHILKISPRTVEGTLLVIKEKSGLLSRDKLAKLVRMNSIII